MLGPGERDRSARRAACALAVVLGCTGSPRPPMYPAGTDKDDGYGDLAQSSARLLTGDRSDAPLNAPHHHRRLDGDPYGGDPYGGGSESDDSDDDAELSDGGSPVLCQSGHRCHRRTLHNPHYNVVSGLTGAIEGTVSWRGASPAALTTSCGAIDPGVRVAANRAVSGVLVYIEHLDIGRPTPTYARPATVGGLIAKRGCTLAPAVQIVAPLPASVAIRGDTTAARLRITPPAGTGTITGTSAPTATFYELEEAGSVVIAAQPGVTRVEAADGSLGVAWIVAADTPYYAITDDRGRFRLDELAAGSYDVAFWRPPLASIAAGKLVYGPPAVVHRTVTISADHPARLDVALSR